MSTTYHETADAVPANSTRRVATASIIGTAIEFYDFYIYATAAALVIGPVFFPQTDPTAQMLASFLTFGIAFIARPLGSALFGHFGDRIGRKSTLVASLLLMGVCTTLIGLLPGYDSIGVGPRFCCACCVSAKGLAWVANGAAQPCWPPRTRRKASAPGSACFHNWAHRSASWPQTGCS
ncbi:MAG: Inner membrane metabolite transport protein YhjE [Pseudomonas fluorescens]|nr:MAG: Inner membrane metabolite transport protein YhjE [Pseudomonas fluorescens]